ncbi:hypothetical protein AN5395.2 [Paecilomyces variotii No. 5]|uniref:Heterokaryon incompatibility domain-containing protein n=1 Tax=Byssochlamys spectabilis (strain No. 5 / NBRC 109023) TaxID=1356009 RepID=V5FVY5_BYSSN|nr:hypothetical protein AN5395.2 [Paecilomyces variotii No. 5]
MEECTPTILRVVYGLLGPYLENDREASLMATCVAWIPSCLLISALLFIPTSFGGENRYGRYEQFKYHYWGHSQVSANREEIPESRVSTLSGLHREANDLSERLLRPRTLCLLDEDSWIPIDVSEYEAAHGSLEYVFICYTAEQFSEDEDKDELHRIAEAAARRAGVAAYWISCTCMPEEQDHCEDVYRISDVVRGAHSLVVIIGSPRGSSSNEREMIRQLGSRMWTFPEALLSRSSRPISVYMRDCDPESCRTLSKRDFAIEAWGDAVVSSQLIDHYEASIILSPLELVSVALQCFPARETGKHYDGDLSYALMVALLVPLFGFEGYMEIGEIEKLLFGINLGRLKWSPYSSHLSWHEDKDGECMGQDPIKNKKFRRIISAARDSQYGDPKVFTLVDTKTLSVTLFEAVRPPVAMLLCGSEGGMQRALLCSYDWKTQTLYRETVLRVDSVVLEGMSRVDRFRLGLHRETAETESIDN